MFLSVVLPNADYSFKRSRIVSQASRNAQQSPSVSALAVAAGPVLPRGHRGLLAAPACAAAPLGSVPAGEGKQRKTS